MITEKILNHYQKSDPKIYPFLNKLIHEYDINPVDPSDYFYHLARKIAFQQLTGKAATTIFNRVLALFGENGFTPENVFDMDHQKMREAGLSNSKVNYIKNIAEAFKSKSVNVDEFAHMSDEEIITELTKIKGVGRWTVEMFLLFTMGREDIFSHGDLGLIKGIKLVYGYKKVPSKKTIERIVKEWSPYKTYGSLTLWRVLDDKIPIEQYFQINQ